MMPTLRSTLLVLLATRSCLAGTDPENGNAFVRRYPWRFAQGFSPPIVTTSLMGLHVATQAAPPAPLRAHVSACGTLQIVSVLHVSPATVSVVYCASVSVSLPSAS